MLEAANVYLSFMWNMGKGIHVRDIPKVIIIIRTGRYFWCLVYFVYLNWTEMELRGSFDAMGGSLRLLLVVFKV